MSAPWKERLRSCEPLGGNRTIASESPPFGVCLVDQHGRTLAADSHGAEARIRDPQLSASIEHVIDGGADMTIKMQSRSGASDHPPVCARVRRLVGLDGPLALIEIFPEPPTAAPPRLDPLTRLSDRAAIADCINAWRRQAAVRPVQFAILFLDLDGFKQINDRHGHAAGDEVLKTLATRWLECVRDGDLVARYGGDEFVVLLNEASTAAEIEPVVSRLRQATERPVQTGGVEARVSATIGVELCASTDRSIDDLIAAADRDMYARKRTLLA